MFVKFLNFYIYSSPLIFFYNCLKSSVQLFPQRFFVYFFLLTKSTFTKKEKSTSFNSIKTFFCLPNQHFSLSIWFTCSPFLPPCFNSSMVLSNKIMNNPSSIHNNTNPTLSNDLFSMFSILLDPYIFYPILFDHNETLSFLLHSFSLI